jgi:hypothetical protein
MGSFVTTYKPVSIVQLKPIDTRPGVKRVRITFGPFELKPASVKRPQTAGKMDPNSDTFSGLASGIPSGLVLSNNHTLTYKDGSVADVVNGVYNHHLMYVDVNKVGSSPIKCAEGNGTTLPDMGLLMGASEANRDLQFSPGKDFDAGFFLSKSDWVMLSAEIVNYTNETKQIYSVTDFEYIETPPKKALDTTMSIFDIDMCSTGNKSIEAPHGHTKWSAKSKKVQMTKNGYILFRRGHMHDGGDAVEFLLNGKQICNSKAIYGGEATTTTIDGKSWQTISKMEACFEPVKVKVGDTLEVAAHFDLQKHPA